jgi:hypothetical protein
VADEREAERGEPEHEWNCEEQISCQELRRARAPVL